MKKGKKGAIFAVLLAVFILAAYKDSAGAASGKKQFDIKGGEVVFLLDASSSMNGQDTGRLAVDAVRQAVYSLPPNYQAGLVVYNTGIQTAIPFGEDLSRWDTLLAEVDYSGYTNAGAAAGQAVEMFSEQEAASRYIIMLTDGEIDMPDSREKEYSRHLYEEAVQRAQEKGIIIYIIAVGSELNEGSELDETGMHIFDGAKMTDGAVCWEGQSGSISKGMEHILYDCMNFPRSSVGISEGTRGRMNVDLPATGAEYVKLVLSAEEMPSSISVDYTAENSRVVNGQKFAVIDILRPSGKSIEINYESAGVSGIEAYMAMGFLAEIRPQVTYRTVADRTVTDRTVMDRSEEAAASGAQLKEEDSQPAYKHFADIEIMLADTKGQNDNLWNSVYYEGREIPFTINGVSARGNIHNGSIMHSMEIDGVDEAVLELDVSGLSEHFEIQQPIVITFSPQEDPLPEPEEKTDYRPLWIILGALVSALAVLFILWARKNGKTVIYMAPPQVPGSAAKKEEIKDCAYTGKLNIYILQTPSGEDVPPGTYRLFGKQSVKISLDRILNSCGIRLGRAGAGDIHFYPGPDRTLLVMDQSEKCTVLRGTEILKKGMGYPVYYNGKITVVLEDGITEAEIHYKSLKPSEQQNI